MQKAGTLLKNAGGRTGWALVEHHMERQIEAGKTTAQDWADELNGADYQAWVLADPADPTSKLVPICWVNPSKEKDPTQTSPGRTKIVRMYERPRRMESWNFYLWWKDEHQGEDVPAWVKAILSDVEFANRCLTAYALIVARAMMPFRASAEEAA